LLDVAGTINENLLATTGAVVRGIMVGGSSAAFCVLTTTVITHLWDAPKWVVAIKWLRSWLRFGLWLGLRFRLRL
jgi:hypothetical protein